MNTRDVETAAMVMKTTWKNAPIEFRTLDSSHLNLLERSRLTMAYSAKNKRTTIGKKRTMAVYFGNASRPHAHVT